MTQAIDLCCGAGGMTHGLLQAGYRVLGVDVIRRRRDYPVQADYLQADVCELSAEDIPDAHFIHASPPCARFSHVRPTRIVDPPTESDLQILKACLRLIEAKQPVYWSVENVRGAVPWFSRLLGKPALKHGPYHFWGNFPPFLVARSGLTKGLTNGRNGKPDRHRSPWLRAKVPPELAVPLAQSTLDKKTGAD